MRKCPCASGGEAVMSEVTIKDIARLCGVGVSTVSRAINDHPDINPTTKKQIQETIEQYGYIPNNSARNLKRTESNAVAVLVKGITNPLFSSMIRVLDEKLKRFKFDMLLQHINYNEDEVAVALELIKEKRLKGIMFPFLPGSLPWQAEPHEYPLQSDRRFQQSIHPLPDNRYPPAIRFPAILPHRRSRRCRRCLLL